MLGKEQVPQCATLGGRWAGGWSRGSETSPGCGRAGPAAHGGTPSGWHLSCPLAPVLRGPSHGGPSMWVSASDVGGRCKWRSEIQDIAASGEWRSTLTSPAGRESLQHVQAPAVLTRVECGPLGSSTKGTQVCPGVSTGTEHIECASLALASVSGDAQCSSLHLGSRLPERTSAGSVASRSLEDTAV